MKCYGYLTFQTVNGCGAIPYGMHAFQLFTKKLTRKVGIKAGTNEDASLTKRFL